MTVPRETLNRLTDALRDGTIRLEVAEIRVTDKVILHFTDQWDIDQCNEWLEITSEILGVPCVGLQEGITVEIVRPGA